MSTVAAMELLKAAGTRLVCVDVGSAGGFHRRMQAVRECADVIGVEADPDECARLNADARVGERHVLAALGREGEKLTFDLHAKRNTSSFYTTATERIRHFDEADRFACDQSLTVMTHSLDTVCAVERIPRIDLLKVDVEGHELAVLEGYSGPVLAIEVEVNFHPFRRGMPLFDEVMGHLRHRGLVLADLRRTFWSPRRARDVRNFPAKGLLIHGDALFVVDPFLSETRSQLASVDVRARYLALLCLYGYPAEALMVIDALEEAGAMPAEEAAERREIICRTAGRWKLPTPRIGKLLLLTERLMAWPVSMASGLFMSMEYQGDRELGNLEQ